MRPRSKLQYQVLELSRYLPDIDNKMLSWAKVECLNHKGFMTKSRVICMDCGQKFAPELVVRKRATCPHCQSKLKVETSMKRTDKQHRYLAIATIFEDFQVVRNYELIAHYKEGQPAYYRIAEILQHWILANGKREVVALNHTLNHYVDSWNGRMEIRNKNNKTTYDVYPYAIHPHSMFADRYTLRGINYRLTGLSPLEAFKAVLNPQAETLLKAKQYALFGCSLEYNGMKIGQYWPSIKICMRNKYIIKDSRLWFDYMDLLNYFNRDLHNAKYVCPKDLKKSHDALVAKKRKVQQAESLVKKREKALRDEKIFQKLKGQFFGIEFSDNGIHIRVLESVKDHMDEGDALKHCVFTNEYYLKPDSLILSATIDGVKKETVEVSIKQLKVVQCYGIRNSNTEYHDRIISLVNKNMHLIKECLKTKKDGAKKNVNRVSAPCHIAV